MTKYRLMLRPSSVNKAIPSTFECVSGRHWRVIWRPTFKRNSRLGTSGFLRENRNCKLQIETENCKLSMNPTEPEKAGKGSSADVDAAVAAMSKCAHAITSGSLRKVHGAVGHLDQFLFVLGS